METPDLNEIQPEEEPQAEPVEEALPVAETPPTPPFLPAVRAAVGASVLYLLFFAAITAFNATAGAFRFPLLAWIGMAVFSTVGYLIILLIVIRAIVRVPLSVRAERNLLFLFLGLFLVGNPMTWKIVGLLLHGQSFAQIIISMTRPAMDPVSTVIVPFLLILTGIFGGRLLSRVIREWNMLLPVGLIAGMIDFWGVYWGPVSFASSNASEAMSGMATATTAAAMVPEDVKAQVPHSLSFLINLQPPQNIGIGDFVFVAFFLACAVRFWTSERRSAWGIFTGLLLASILFAMEGVKIGGLDIRFDYLPGLVFICAGMLFANAGRWRLAKQEWAMTGALVLVLGAFIGFTAVQAELSQPRSHKLITQIHAGTDREVIEGMLRVITRDSLAPVTLSPQDIFCAYTRTADGATLQYVRLTVTAYDDAKPRVSWFYLLEGKPEKGKWTLGLDGTRTPLTDPADIARIKKSGIRATWPVVMEALPANFSVFKPGKQFGVEFTPDAVLMGDEKKVVATLKYPKP